MNLFLLLLTLLLLVPENGTNNALGNDALKEAYNEIVPSFSSAEQEQVSDHDDIDDKAFSIAPLFVSSEQHDIRHFTHEHKTAANCAAHPIRAPPHNS